MAGDKLVILTVEIQREGEHWVGRCVELGTATFGDSVDEVHEELVDLVVLHLNGLEDAGERERFLEAHGIKVYEDSVPHEVERPVPISRDAPLFTQILPMQIGSPHSTATMATA